VSERLLNILMELCEAVAQRDRSFETVDSWLHNDAGGLRHRAVEALTGDPVIGLAVESRSFLWLVSGGGSGLNPISGWLAGFLLEAERRPASEWRDEAETFLRTLRVGSGGTVPVLVRATLAGVKLDGHDPIELPFGRLRAGGPRDIADPNAGRTPPACAVFDYQIEMDAAIGPVFPFDDLQLDAAKGQVETDHEIRMTRMLLCLVMVSDGPMQEHLVMRFPRYSGGGSGINAPPLAPFVTRTPHLLLNRQELLRLRETAEAVATIPVDHLGVAVRRLVMAGSERLRPADKIIDYVIAIESITGPGPSKQQGAALARLIGGTPVEQEAIRADHRALADARNEIVHEGRTRLEHVDLAHSGRTLVRLAIEAYVARELRDRTSQDPAHPGGQ
jgi:hypothetical protein